MVLYLVLSRLVVLCTINSTRGLINTEPNMKFTDRLKERVQKAKEAMIVPIAVSDQRIAICNGCPELFKPTMTCKKCGCFMTGKTKLVDVTCPLGKW